jgi:UDP-2,4-diacetamido-2,4,6-trideoxy-beta-L-altropyranose hydrolase
MKASHIAFRTDASIQIGTGHFMRCLTLAEALKSQGAYIRFVSRNLPEHLQIMLAEKNMEFSSLGIDVTQSPDGERAQTGWLGVNQLQDATDTIQALSDRAWDILIVDHYQFNATWEQLLRPYAHKLMVIDDLANRSHDCDLLLDQNYYRDLDQRYQGLVQEQCVMLLGPSYVLLRPEFAEARRMLRSRDGKIRRILVFFGGSDPYNQTLKAVTALKLLDRPDIKIDVVVGLANPNQNSVKTLCDEIPNATFHCQVSNMAELIQNADLGIGAGGSAMWERCCLGLPTITVIFAENQKRTTEDVAEIGAIEYLGGAEQLSPEDYARSIYGMMENPQRVMQIGEAALGVLQMGWGGLGDLANRIVQDLECFHSFNRSVPPNSVLI